MNVMFYQERVFRQFLQDENSSLRINSQPFRPLHIPGLSGEADGRGERADQARVPEVLRPLLRVRGRRHHARKDPQLVAEADVRNTVGAEELGLLVNYLGRDFKK